MDTVMVTWYTLDIFKSILHSEATLPEKLEPSKKEQEWLTHLASVRPETTLPGYWDTLANNCDDWAREITVSSFWTEAKKILPSWANDYSSRFGDSLRSMQGLPHFEGKGARRIREKLL